MVRIVERRGGIYCCKNTLFVGISKLFLGNLLVKHAI